MKLYSKIYQFFEKPFRFIAVKEFFTNAPLTILDVGCGNHSPILTKRYFSNCIYHGLDNSNWNRNDKDQQLIDQFFKINLENLDEINIIADGYYDLIVLSHVLEHLSNPYELFLQLLMKLKDKGLVYIEFPSPKTLRFPRACNGWYGIKGCLNFYDDSTHKTLVIDKEIINLLPKDCNVIKYGTVVRLRRIIFLPLYVLAGLLMRGYIPATVVWDITGFSNYIILRKEKLDIA